MSYDLVRGAWGQVTTSTLIPHQFQTIPPKKWNAFQDFAVTCPVSPSHKKKRLCVTIQTRP